MAGISKLVQEFAYTLNGPEPIIALGEKDPTYGLPRLRFRIQHSVENKATDLGLQNRVEKIFPTGGGMMTYPTERDPRLMHCPN